MKEFNDLLRANGLLKNEQKNDADWITWEEEGAMMAHILDCLVALGNIHQTRADLKSDGVDGVTAKVQEAHHRVFRAAVMTAMERFVVLNEESYATQIMEQSWIMDKVLEAFSDQTMRPNSQSWLPLHWAVMLLSSPPVVVEQVTIEDVQEIYGKDAFALQTFHATPTADSDYKFAVNGLTAAQILCATPNASMPLVRLFSVCNPTAFAMNGCAPEEVDEDGDDDEDEGAVVRYAFSALHAACVYGTPSAELLRHLLQLDPSQTKVRGSVSGDVGGRNVGNHWPLGYLCKLFIRCNGTLYHDSIQCLLDVDSSAEVVADAVQACYHVVRHDDQNQVSQLVTMLLDRNPEAARYRDNDGRNLLFHAIDNCYSFNSIDAFKVIKLILAHHKDAAKEADNEGLFPAHLAVSWCYVDVIQFVIDLYPAATAALTSDGQNLLHLAITATHHDDNNHLDILKLLCSRYPEMLHQRDAQGYTPLHLRYEHYISRDLAVVECLCAAGGLCLLRTPVIHPTDANFIRNGWLPLHFLIRNMNMFGSNDQLWVGQLRYMLAACPDTAGIEGGLGAHKTTPYHLAVKLKKSPLCRRLLLRAVPTLDPEALRRLTYAERRMAMFLAFRALPATVQDLPILARLRAENKDLVRRVVSFL